MAGPTATKQQVEQMLRDKKRSFDAKIDEMHRAHLANMERFAGSVIAEMQSIASQYGYRANVTMAWSTYGPVKYEPTISGLGVIGNGQSIRVR